MDEKTFGDQFKPSDTNHQVSREMLEGLVGAFVNKAQIPKTQGGLLSQQSYPTRLTHTTPEHHESNWGDTVRRSLDAGQADSSDIRGGTATPKEVARDVASKRPLLLPPHIDPYDPHPFDGEENPNVEMSVNFEQHLASEGIFPSSHHSMDAMGNEVKVHEFEVDGEPTIVDFESHGIDPSSNFPKIMKRGDYEGYLKGIGFGELRNSGARIPPNSNIIPKEYRKSSNFGTAFVDSTPRSQKEQWENIRDVAAVRNRSRLDAFHTARGGASPEHEDFDTEAFLRNLKGE